jgi:hypothetical protein
MGGRVRIGRGRARRCGGVGERGDGRERGGDSRAAAEGGGGGPEKSGGRHGWKLKIDGSVTSGFGLDVGSALGFGLLRGPA